MRLIPPPGAWLPLEVLLIIIFSAFSLPISIIDILRRRIPDILSFPCFFFLAAARVFAAPETLAPALWGSFAAFLLMALIRAAVGGIGMGDLKLAAVMGLACSFPRVFAALLTASLLGLAVCLPVLLRAASRGRTAGGKYRVSIPFAPFLCGGAILTQLAGIFGL
jgi:prepilin signal peptidase PulO-like enzyme (type II secretory pathway)